MYASVIIPTYNRKTILENTLKSLLNQTAGRSAYEVIVIDDCSIDNTAEYMRQIIVSESNVKFIQHDENRGRVITRNDGISKACGDIVIFLDDDNVPARNFIEEHMKFYESKPEDKIAIMGNVSYAPEVIGKSNFSRFMQSRYLGNRSNRERSGIDYKDLPARCLGTLNCSARRVDLIEAGKFDESFLHYGAEDEYLGQCLKGNGVRLIFGENAHSLHYDILSLHRYKQKILETAKFGLNVLKTKSPQYFESTQVKYLLPISLDKDNLKRIIAKVIIKAALNRFTVLCIEKWLTTTDTISSLYFAPLYRILIAGWIIHGQKLKRDDVYVKYEAIVR
jgi:glycosyltransferase involved in cell wall biosynthesis